MNGCAVDTSRAANAVSLSVLVAVFQSSSFLRRLVASLAAQNVQDAEFVFCDDGSTDGTADILQGFLAEYGLDGRARVLRHGTNCGVCRTRQDLLDAATGEYFIFMDSDDMVDAGMHAEMLATAREKDADLVWEGYFEEKDGVATRHDERLPEGATAHDMRRAILRDEIYGSLWNKMIRLDFVRRRAMRFRPENTCCIDDLDFMVDVLAESPRIAYNPGCHYRYMLREGSISHVSSLPYLSAFKRIAYRLEHLAVSPEDRAAVQVFKARFRYYAAMDFSVPDDVFASYFPETRSLLGRFSAKQRIMFWLSARGMRPLVRFVWRLFHHEAQSSKAGGGAGA